MLRSEQLNKGDKNIALERDDVKIITGMSNTHLAISNADIVLARGGYNILSELIALNKKSLIIEEENNPEIVSNLELAENFKNLIITNHKNAFRELSKLIKDYNKSEKEDVFSSKKSAVLEHLRFFI